MSEEKKTNEAVKDTAPVKEKSDLVKNTVILFAITLIAAVLLGLVYEITKDPIAEQQVKRKNEAYASVFPGLSETKEDAALTELAAGYKDTLAGQGIGNVTVSEAYVALDASGAPAGYVMTVVSSNGYGGDIEFAMGVDKNGISKGISFLSIAETPGLGMNATKETFTDQFKDKDTDSYSFAKKKIEGSTPVDQISSASITTAAVTLGVNGGLSFANAALGAGIGGIK